MTVDKHLRRFRDRHLAALERLRAAKPRGAKLNRQLAAREHLLSMLPETFERELDPVYEAERKALRDDPSLLIQATTEAAELAFELVAELAVESEDAELYQAAATLREDAAALFAQGARRCVRCSRVLALSEFGEAPGAPDGSFRKRRCDTCERLDTRWSNDG